MIYKSRKEKKIEFIEIKKRGDSNLYIVFKFEINNSAQDILISDIIEQQYKVSSDSLFEAVECHYLDIFSSDNYEKLLELIENKNFSKTYDREPIWRLNKLARQYQKITYIGGHFTLGVDEFYFYLNNGNNSFDYAQYLEKEQLRYTLIKNILEILLGEELKKMSSYQSKFSNIFFGVNKLRKLQIENLVILDKYEYPIFDCLTTNRNYFLITTDNLISLHNNQLYQLQKNDDEVNNDIIINIDESSEEVNQYSIEGVLVNFTFTIEKGLPDEFVMLILKNHFNLTYSG